MVNEKREFLQIALGVAFERSDLAQQIGMPALNMIFGSQMGKIYEGRGMNLAPLWDALLAEPGVHPSQVTPPMLALKSWEGLLGLMVQLPAPLERLSPEKRQFALSQLHLGASEAAKIISARMPQRTPTPSRSASVSDVLLKAAMEAPVDIGLPSHQELYGFTPDAPAAKETASAWPARILFVLLLAALSGLGWFGYQKYFSEIVTQPFDPKRVSHLVVIRDAEQRGPYFYATLADTEWEKRPIEERQRRVQLLADELRGRGVAFVYLFDNRRKVRARAGIDPGGARILDHWR